jgi:nucleotide-binding universal stress UspA family protein
VNVHMRSGDPAAAIVTAARELDADLIVMATHARGNRSVLALTSVSRAVVSQSQVPVLLVRPGARGTQRIRTLLVPVDGSPGGSLALAAAIAMAHTMQARLVLLQVVVPLNADEVAALPGMTLGGFIDPAWGNLAVAGAEAYVHKLADHLTAGGLVCEAHVAVGEVAPEIVRCSTDVGADLVVMSTHARTWPGEALVGSVALNVLEYGELPLLLVHREPPAGEVIAESETPSMLASTISGGH